MSPMLKGVLIGVGLSVLALVIGVGLFVWANLDLIEYRLSH